MVELRPYQRRSIEQLRASYTAGRSAPCLVQPTGGGKTLIAAEIIRLTVQRGTPVLFNAHREELIGQTVAKLADAGVQNVRTIQADRGRHTNAPVTVASVQTLTRYPADRMPQAGLVVFDECHHVVAKTWKRIATHYAQARLLGLTATPARADGSPLGDIFDALVVGATVRELTELGHLVPCRVWAPPRILEAAELAMSPVDAYRQHGAEQRAIAFCSTVEHATQLADSFNTAGITSAVLHGSMARTARVQTLAWFREGQIRVLCNVHVLTEGFDDPGASVAILCRKPEHVGTYLQMVGRILRPAPGKTAATVIDLCGSSLVHGTPEMERTYSLDGRAISGAEREAIRQCPTCGGVFLAAAVTEGCCPQCGVEIPKPERKEPRVLDVGLVEAQRSDQLRLNLQAAARRSRRSQEWVERAHAAIMRRGG